MVAGGAVQDGQLRRAREARHLTQTDIAERLAEIAWFRDRTRVGVAADMVSKWERGEKQPNRLYRELLCLLFDESPEALGLAAAPLGFPATIGVHDPVPSAGVAWAEVLLALGEPSHLLHRNLIEQWEDDLMKRREMLKSMGLAAIASTLGSLSPPVARGARFEQNLRADPETLDGLASLAMSYQRLYHSTAPRMLMAPITAHLRTVEDLLKNAANIKQRRLLLANHSQVAQLAGRLAFFDLQDPLGARGYFMTAYDSAVAAGDASLAAGALGHLSFVPAAAGQWTAAADHLAHARRRADSGAPTVVRSWLAAVTSEIRTNEGDHRAALTSIDDAKRLLASGSSTLVPDWFDFYDRTRLHGFEGYALLRGGNTVAAVGELQIALASLGPSAIKQRTVFLADLASASVLQGEVDRACDLAIEAATALTTRRYATCVNRLRDFRSTLRPYATSRAVRDLDRVLVEL